ncbi:MAG: UvrD-helicase domain-containing protein [Spirochaetes bacterium]|nr:UvrD-helicase domain-containing protein [Spirochaetota bacterium]
MPDTALELPRVTVLKASAGSGKTWTLTRRYVQFALSREVPANGLASLLAITFSNNATREMKENVLEWLKRLALGDAERTASMRAIVSGGGLAARSARLLDDILDGWSDFQVRTIDSFMNSVFRGAAIAFGYSPEMETTTRLAPIVDYAFDLFLREAEPGSASAALLDETIRKVLANRSEENAFAWDPVALLRGAVAGLEGTLSELEEPLAPVDLGPAMHELEARIAAALETVDGIVQTAGLEPGARSKLATALAHARAGRFTDLLWTSLKTCPVNKPRSRDAAALARYERIVGEWAMARAYVGRYAGLWARAYWAPVIRLHTALEPALRRARRVRGAIYLGDIKRALRAWLDAGAVPDVYFQLGEKVHHWLIDEFQDTSPLQWKILLPLVENSLASGGSLFVVGDTKQAIYGFRQADWRIMHDLATENPFPSVLRHESPELTVSRRSRPRVLALTERVFHGAAAPDSAWGRYAAASGLTTYRQTAVDPDRDPGYAEVAVLGREKEAAPERDLMGETVRGLHERGYAWSDITVLAATNDHVVRAAARLAADDVPVLSSSSLDARARPVVAEALALLAFLDSPPDDLAFAGFLCGSLFAASVADRYPELDRDGVRRFLFASRGRHPLYKEFQLSFPDAWSYFFAGLFTSTGYLPLYDLASRALGSFEAFRKLKCEEAAFARLLEAVKAFEGSGANSLHAFLASAREEGGEEWDIVAPPGIDAVRVMTVHKAKGLGFPVVVLLLYGQGYKADPWAVVRGEAGIELVRVNEDLAGMDPALEQVQDAQKSRFWVDRLNTLYVALTRAKRELYVIGARGEKDTFPFTLLPEDEFAPRDDKGKPLGEPRGSERRAHLDPVPPLEPPDTGGARLSYGDRRRGRFIHRVLELVKTADDLEATLGDAAARVAREERAGPADDLPDLAAALRQLGLADGFAPRADREVFTERDFCDERGRVHRMDRLVVDTDRVLVVDWKTGGEEIGTPEQEAQVRAYAGILRQVYPGRMVDALLVHLDRLETRSVP